MNVHWKGNDDDHPPGVGNTILMIGLTLLKFTQQSISSIPGKSWCGLSDLVCIQGSLLFNLYFLGANSVVVVFPLGLRRPFKKFYPETPLNLINPVH